jgi:hypothetical protein
MGSTDPGPPFPRFWLKGIDHKAPVVHSPQFPFRLPTYTDGASWRQTALGSGALAENHADSIASRRRSDVGEDFAIIGYGTFETRVRRAPGPKS